MTKDTCKIYDTIIVGAGISGIGCAHGLLKNGYKNFKIISPNIGGRITESDSGTVEYGAYYIMDIYHHTKEFVQKGRKIHPMKVLFHNRNTMYPLLHKKFFHHIYQYLKLVCILYKFKRHYEKFKKNNLYQSQVACLKADPYLWALYQQNAKDFVSEKKIENIVYDYLAEILHGSAFTPIGTLNAFTFLHFSLPVIVPTHEFLFKKADVKKYIGKNYIQGTVEKITKKDDIHEVRVETGDVYFCKNIVVATQPTVAKNLLGHAQKLRGPVQAHLFHLIGEVKGVWNYKVDNNLFSDNSRMLAISHQADNSYLFYTKDQKPRFDKYFYNYKIIEHKLWDPAFNITGSHIVNFAQGGRI